MVTESFGHDLIFFLCKPYLIGVNRDYMLPVRAGTGQGSLDIPKALGDLLRKRLREMLVLIPTTESWLSRYMSEPATTTLPTVWRCCDWQS